MDKNNNNKIKFSKIPINNRFIFHSKFYLKTSLKSGLCLIGEPNNQAFQNNTNIFSSDQQKTKK